MKIKVEETTGKGNWPGYFVYWGDDFKKKSIFFISQGSPYPLWGGGDEPTNEIRELAKEKLMKGR